MAHAYNPRTQEAELGGCLVPGQSDLQSEFKDSQCYETKKPCLGKPKPK